LNKINKNKFVLLAFVSVFLLSATLGNSFMTEAPFEKTTNSDTIESFPLAGKFYTLAGRSFSWGVVDGENVTTSHSEEIHKWSIQDVVGNVALVNRTYVESYIQPETGVNYTDTLDIDYQIATNRTILSAYWKTMTFTTKGYSGSSERPLDEDIDEHTWGWFPTNLSVGTYVLVSWTTDNNFPNDMLYQVVGEEVIEVLSDRQDCWMLHMPPVVTIDGTQGRAETYWVDKDTGIPLKVYAKGWALDGSFGWEDESVLVNTNIDLGPGSTQPPSPTYTLTVPTTPGFPQAGKFYTWYILDGGWYISGESNVTYYYEGLFTIWVVNVTDDEAFVYRILWFEEGTNVAEGVEELEAAYIQYYNYTINIKTREILEVTGTFYSINMTSLTHSIEDRTSQLAGDIGEETFYWLPKNLYLEAVVSISWTRDMPWNVDNGTYTVTGEKLVNAFDKPQECWILYMPPTPSIDGTWNYSETFYSDEDTGIPLCDFCDGWTVDGNSGDKSVLQIMDTNVDLRPPFPQSGMSYTLAGRSVGWVTVDGKNITYHEEEIHKWSVQDVVGDVAFVNRTYLDVYICPETGGNHTDTYDFDYQIAINRTILSAYLKTMSFDTTGFLGSSAEPLDMDVGEHTWGWFSTDLHIGSYVLVSWTWDRNFLGDTLYEIVGEEVIQVIGQKQDCWLLHMPPAITVDGTQGREETYWVDKDTGIPVKLYSKGWALDESFGWEGEDVLVHTNIDLGPESTQTPSPTYSLTVSTTPSFPEAGKFWSWYVLDEGWSMIDTTNVTYYEELLLTRWVVDVTDDEALVYKIWWGDLLGGAENIEELERVEMLCKVYRARISTREILEAISCTYYSINMTSLIPYGPVDLTDDLAADVGEETYCWLPTNLYIGANVNITWSFDRLWGLDNATYSVIDEKILSALGEPQAYWVLYLPPTASIDGTWNYSETWYSDKDVGIPMGIVSKGWAVDGSSAWVENGWLIDTNVDLGPCTYYLTITSTGGGTTNPLPGTYNYTEGSSLNVTAIPYSGYSFDYWLLDGEERTENPITMIINANHTLEAVFVDIPPEISIISPENKTYPIKDVPLTFTVSESTSWIGYSLNSQKNVTITGNRTLTSLQDGSHYVIVYANDTAGNMGASETVHFTVDTTPPNITNVIQNPPKNNVLPEDAVKINATVTDNLSEVKQVTLIYAYSNSSGTWIRIINMTNLEGNIWNATIPALPYCTNVTYSIMAEDKAGNSITTIEMGYEYQYPVIPEFPTAIIMPLFTIATLLTLIVYRRKQNRRLQEKG